jgi:hypothetical protein
VSRKKGKKSAKLNNGRDYLMVRLIQGATKAGVAKDRKKEQNRRSCRRKVEVE